MVCHQRRLSEYGKNIISALRRHIDLFIAFVFAVGSLGYAGKSAAVIPYIQWETLGVLFSLMVVLAGLKEAGTIRFLSVELLKRCHGTRQIIACFTMICFFVSMIMTNDAVLLTCVPMSLAILQDIGQQENMIFMAVMETLAANMGSALLPSGNPQNIYLYFHYHLSLGGFLSVTIPMVALAGGMLYLFIRRHPSRDIGQTAVPSYILSARETRIFLLLLCVVAASVLRVIPWTISFVLTFFGAALIRPRLLKGVDWKLLALFCFLFIGVGNLSHQPSFSSWAMHLVEGHELWAGILVSQFISNVPAAVLLSQYTSHGLALVMGTNIGGMGTLIASMASLISFRAITRVPGIRRSEYLLQFTVWNVIFLLIEIGFVYMLLQIFPALARMI
jgi:Na+/H+ antiporter NhaD/arsenite permease-like protein